MSHNAASHNIVLKVVVPKRTGRKRKREPDSPWVEPCTSTAVESHQRLAEPPANVLSYARKDDPRLLRRKLEENIGRYTADAIGTIRHTHRFRGLSDFYWDMSGSDFAQRYAKKALPGDGKPSSSEEVIFGTDISITVTQLKQFQFKPGTDTGANVDIIPPPSFTHMPLPFNYLYSQNPYVRVTESGETINQTAAKLVGYFIGVNEATPSGPQELPNPRDLRMKEVIGHMESLFQTRPIWTRRAILNSLEGKVRSWNELKKYLNYAAYQFKGGPWRDSVIPYGLDPRTDPKYRIYQTVMFKLQRRDPLRVTKSWHAVRREQLAPTRDIVGEDMPRSHLFDGKTYYPDGKIWQICDITDPLLCRLLDQAAIRPTWSTTSGWYHGGLWAKIKGIMKTKLVAIQFDRTLTDEDFAGTLQVGDATPLRPANNAATFSLPLPNLGLTQEELTQMKGKQPVPRNRKSLYSGRAREMGRSRTYFRESEPAEIANDPQGSGQERLEDANIDEAESGDDNDEAEEDEDGSEGESDDEEGDEE